MSSLILPSNANEALAKAADCILRGGVIAYPTETLYGLGARYDSESALSRLYDLKLRPIDKTMPLIIGNIADLETLTNEVPKIAKKIMEKFWPGPLTILFKAKTNLSGFITRDSRVAARMPGESFALDLARLVGIPITSTSANISGMPPARNACEVRAYFNSDLDIIIDGGECAGNQPSTIIDIASGDIVLVREGPVGLSEILAVLK